MGYYWEFRKRLFATGMAIQLKQECGNVWQTLRCDLTIFFPGPCDCLFSCYLLCPFTCANRRVDSAVSSLNSLMFPPEYPFLLCRPVCLPTTEKSHSFFLLRYLSSSYYSCFSLADLACFTSLVAHCSNLKIKLFVSLCF